MEITFTSEITVNLIQQVGSDAIVVAAARTSTSGEEALKFAAAEQSEGNAGLINYLIANRHGSPFEHGLLTLYIHAPAFVWWEWIRHRVGMTVDCPEMSFSMESGRYRELKPVFWVPRPDRPMTPAEGHKAARPKFEVASKPVYNAVVREMRSAYERAWESYQNLVHARIANEVDRSVLGFGIYYSGWVTANPRSLMHFLSLRTKSEVAKYPSYPQAEIEEAARKAEGFFAESWPLTYAAFVAHGRVAP